MSNSPISSKLQRKLNLNRYLEELTVLTGRPVNADELCSLEDVYSMRDVNQKFTKQASHKFEIPFSEKVSSRFRYFIQSLRVANSAPVYIWTPRTMICGAFLAPSIDAINFNFDFAINGEGMLAFVTSDSEDSLLLDFSVSTAGEQILEVETQGTNWLNVAY